MSVPLVVFGSGGHAKVVVEAVWARTPERPLVIIDDDPKSTCRKLLGLSVTGTRQWLATNLPGAAVALGVGTNRARAEIADWLIAQGRGLETVVHPSAIVGTTAELGPGAFLAAGSIVIADARVGRGAIVNTAASVDHDCDVGDCAHIGPGVRLCGNVRVGDRTLIGVGSAIRPGIAIGSDVTVGAGSAVVCDLADGGTYAGCPAQPLPARG